MMGAVSTAGASGLRARGLKFVLLLCLGCAVASTWADDPIDPDVAPRYGRYASTLAFQQGGEADRLGLEAEKAPIPGAEDAAVEIDPEPDAEGNAKWVHFRLEVDEVQEEVYPGEFVTFWVYAPLGKAMGAPPRAPSPTLRVQEGDRVIVTLYNTHYLPHTIHFHGMDQPADMDGVPDMPHAWVKPGESFTYEFTAKHPGTYFYHCHVNEEVHVPMGLGGMFIVEPRRPHNHFARLVPGAGRIAVLGKGTAEQYQREYSLVYLDIDSRLNRIPAQHGDPRDIEKRMHREYDSTQRMPDVFLLNGRSFPFTLRDTPIMVASDERTKLRILNMGGHTVYFHTHGHHPTLTDTDGRPVPPGGQLTRDTFDVGPSQRIDLSLDTGSQSQNAAGPGHWMVHDHTPAAATNRGIGPGGSHTAIVYQTPVTDGSVPGAADAQHLLHMHAKYFDAAYYQGTQPVFGTGIFHASASSYDTRPAGAADTPYPMRAPRTGAVPRLDLIDAQRHRPVASACSSKARSLRRIVIKAGAQFGKPGEVYGFEPRQIRLEKCQEVEVVLENHDSIRHDLMIPGLNPMFTLNFIGPGSQTARFITPDTDVTLPFHCHVPVHDKVGMLGEFIIGKGSATVIKVQAKLPPSPAAAKIYEGVGTVLAILPRQGRVLIKHDDIKGYMAAMEMSFPLARPDVASGIAEGDRVAFKLNGVTAEVTEMRVLDRPR